MIIHNRIDCPIYLKYLKLIINSNNNTVFIPKIKTNCSLLSPAIVLMPVGNSAGVDLLFFVIIAI